MLKEVYVLEDGLIAFHYTNEKDVDESSLVLASGFLSALESFSKETRAASIDFFASDSEFFIFDEFKEHNKQLIGIFSNEIEHAVGREIIKQLKRLIYHSNILDLYLELNSREVEELKLKDKIDQLAKSLSSVNFQIEASGDLFDEIEEISLLILHDYTGKTVHFVESRPPEFYHEEQLVALRSVHRYTKRMIKSLNLGSNFELLTIDSDDYSLVLSKKGMVITLCFSQKPTSINKIHEVPLRILSLPDYESYKQDFSDLDKKSTLIIDRYDKVHVQFGEATSLKAESSIVKEFSALERLFNSLEIQFFHNISIYISDPKFAMIRIMNRFTTRERIIEIYV